MFDVLKQNPNQPRISMEAAASDKTEQKRAFLVSRLERRWAFNKNAPDEARAALRRLQTTFDRHRKTVGRHPKFDEKAFSSMIESKQFIEAKLMNAGLSEIESLSKVFADIAAQPPSTETANLPKFKAVMQSALQKHTSAYAYASYQVYAAFMVNKSLVKTHGRLSDAGYTGTFIDTVETALNSMDHLITSMEHNEPLIHKLGDAIVTALMGKNASDYRHARRQYELLCTVYNSILTKGPLQYMTLSMSTLTSMVSFYR